MQSESESEVAQSCQLFATPWTVAYQAPPSMGLSWQEYWSGLLFPSTGGPANPGIKPGSPALEADPLTSEPPGKLLVSFCLRPEIIFLQDLKYTACILLPTVRTRKLERR